MKKSEEIPSPTKIEFDKVVHDEKIKKVLQLCGVVRDRRPKHVSDDLFDQRLRILAAALFDLGQSPRYEAERHRLATVVRGVFQGTKFCV